LLRKSKKRKNLDGFNDDGESWCQIGNNGRILFDRPKPTAGCSASGRRRRYMYIIYVSISGPSYSRMSRGALGEGQNILLASNIKIL
jgi:hypothetical protein